MKGSLMKRVLLALALVLSIFTISAVTQQPKPQTWEYKFVYQCDEKKANANAAEGWELVTLSMTSYGSIGVGTCAFKRPR